MTKRCATCQQFLPISEFGPDKKHSDGLNSWCRPCCRTWKKERRANATEEQKERLREYLLANRDHINERRRRKTAVTPRTDKRYFSGPYFREEDKGYSTPCWIWLHTIGRSGYGSIITNGRHTTAHRAYYEFYRGPIPAGLELDHLCRVHPCCNPNHLEAVTPAENVRRGLVGMRGAAIRARVLAEPADDSSGVVARRLGFGITTVQRIRKKARCGELAAALKATEGKAA